MKLRSKLILSDVMWFVVGPLLFLAGLYVSSWFILSAVGLFLGLGFYTRDFRPGRTHVNPVHSLRMLYTRRRGWNRETRRLEYSDMQGRAYKR